MKHWVLGSPSDPLSTESYQGLQLVYDGQCNMESAVWSRCGAEGELLVGDKEDMWNLH